MIYLTETANLDPTLIQKFIYELPEKALNLGVRILYALIFIAIGAQLIKMARRIIKKTIQRTGAEQGVITFVDSFVKAGLYIVLALFIASYFGVDAASVIALVGSAGVAIGLAVQGSLSNLAGGVLLLLLKPFVVGDYIVDSNGMEGTVQEIQIFFTKLKTPDNKTIILPNGNLANNSIVNVTTAKSRRCDIVVGISYDSDIKKAKEVLMEVLNKEEKVLRDRDVNVFVDQLADSSINICVRCWFDNADFWPAKWRLNENIKYALDEAGITIPFPQMDVHVKKDL